MNRFVEWIAEARPVLEGLKARRERVKVPANVALAESDARELIYCVRRLIADAIRESALDNAEFIDAARELEDQARELIA